MVWMTYRAECHQHIGGTLTHRPHSRQVTGARCTEVAARQSWAEYSSRPTTDSWIQGWAIKDFSVLNVMHCISKYTINGIFSIILNFNQPTILMKPKNLQLLYISILKNKKASGHSHILLTSVRACSSWLNSSWPGTHMLIRYGSMTPSGAHMRPMLTRSAPLRNEVALTCTTCLSTKSSKTNPRALSPLGLLTLRALCRIK